MQLVLAGLAAAHLAGAPGIASAGPGKHKQGKYEYKYDDGNCKYKYKADRKGYKEQVKCRDAHYAGGPPPWAPAHGYRAQHQHAAAEPYRAPFDLDLGRCNRQLLGGILGGAAGAGIGTQIGKGDGRTVAIIGGTVIGILVGGSIGRMMDEVDQTCVGQALEHAPDGREIVWQDPQSDARYQVVPTGTFEETSGRYCREYTAVATVGGRAQQVYGQACRQPDGSWELIS